MSPWACDHSVAVRSPPPQRVANAGTPVPRRVMRLLKETSPWVRHSAADRPAWESRLTVIAAGSCGVWTVPSYTRRTFGAFVSVGSVTVPGPHLASGWPLGTVSGCPATVMLPSASTVSGVRARSVASSVHVPGDASMSRGAAPLALLVSATALPASVAVSAAPSPAAQSPRARNVPARVLVEAVPAAAGKRVSRFCPPPAAGMSPSCQRAASLHAPLPCQAYTLPGAAQARLPLPEKMPLVWAASKVPAAGVPSSAT
ncbi:MAG: hypothetical protein BWX70_02388 [Verrucomicrobia bacterium ADurb.Bin070]|nr:MAG: hypothetical protein BWX70_02388 [Verrucomicrobia bacterium ADurb.Bin070]